MPSVEPPRQHVRRLWPCLGYGGTNPGIGGTSRVRGNNQVLSAHGATYVRSILGLALSSQVVAGKTVRYITHPSGTNIGYVAPEGQAWYLTDRLGTVIGLVSDAGALIASYAYDPTGIPRATTETGTVAGYNIHRYAGGLLDKTTGLTRFGVRCGGTSRLRGNNPTTARFTTPDPSGKEKNTYLYAGGSACNRVDSRGEDAATGACVLFVVSTATGALDIAAGVLAGTAPKLLSLISFSAGWLAR